MFEIWFRVYRDYDSIEYMEFIPTNFREMAFQILPQQFFQNVEKVDCFIKPFILNYTFISLWSCN